MEAYHSSGNFNLIELNWKVHMLMKTKQILKNKYIVWNQCSGKEMTRIITVKEGFADQELILNKHFHGFQFSD